MNKTTKMQIALMVFAAISVPAAAYAVTPFLGETAMAQEFGQDYEISEQTQLRLEGLSESEEQQRIRGAR